MKRVALLAVLGAGCHDWDSELAKRLFELRDAGPPDSGAPDAGPPDAGPPDAGPPDAGCRDPFCHLDTYLIGEGVNGAVMRNLGDVAIAGDVGNFSFTARTRMAPLADGGMWRVVKSGGDPISPVFVTGIDPDDLWLWHTDTLLHQEADVITDDVGNSKCGFEAGFWHDGVAVSHHEAWFAGSKFAVCHWRRDAGFEPSTPDANFSNPLSLEAIAVEPGGEVLLAESSGDFYRLDGGLAGLPPLPGANAPARSIQFAPNGDLWVLASTDKVFRLESDGGWRAFTISTGNFELWALEVVAANDVWVGGNGVLKHFDGGTFTSVLGDLPGLPDSPIVYGIASTGPGNLVITGFTRLQTTGSYGFVSRYTRP